MIKFFAGAVRKLYQDADELEKNTALSADERLRLRHFTLFLLLGVPTMVVFGLLNLMEKKYLLLALIILSAGGLTVGWSLLRRLKHIKAVYRTNALLFSLIILYGPIVNDQSGKLLWLYTFPLISMFLFGEKEGSLWNLFVFLSALVLSFNPFNLPFGYSLPQSLILRFIATYLIVSVLAQWFEFQRHCYSVDVEQKNRLLEQEIKEREKTRKEREELITELQQALDEVKTLSGLLPICSNCKKIRDDKGYWNKIEGYIQEHSQAKFSHSICPECARKLYPDLDINKD